MLKLNSLPSLCKLQFNSTQKLVNINIPSGSNVLIGGYLSRGVPNKLVDLLTQSACNQLTLITNASFLSSPSLKRILQQSGKVKRVITSLEHNRLLSKTSNQVLK